MFFEFLILVALLGAVASGIETVASPYQRRPRQPRK